MENQNGCLEQKESEGIEGLIDMLRTYVCDSICGCRNFGEVLETTCKECRSLAAKDYKLLVSEYIQAAGLLFRQEGVSGVEERGEN